MEDAAPIVEFALKNIIESVIHIPDDQKWRLDGFYEQRIFYVEYRTNDAANVKIYFQRRAVDYADYKPGLYYISPFDLLVNGEPVIVSKKEAAPAGVQLQLF